MLGDVSLLIVEIFLNILVVVRRLSAGWSKSEWKRGLGSPLNMVNLLTE